MAYRNVHQTGAVTQTPGRPTYQNVHQTGAVTQTPGRPPSTVTTAGGPPSILNRPPTIPKGRTHPGGIPGRNSLWNKWMQHKTMVNLIKEGKGKDYHQLGAHDFMQRYNIPKWVGNKLATGYQYGSELARQIIPVNKKNIYTAIGEDLKKDKPFEPLGAVIGSISNALDRAKEESRLNREGIEGLTGPQQEVYDQYAKMFNPTLKKMYPDTSMLSSGLNPPGTSMLSSGLNPPGTTMLSSGPRSGTTMLSSGEYIPRQLRSGLNLARGGIVDLYRYGGF